MKIVCHTCLDLNKFSIGRDGILSKLRFLICYEMAAESGRMRGKMRVSENVVSPYSAYATDKSYTDRIITENEDKSKNIENDSFTHSNRYIGKDSFLQNLDLTYLIDKPDGYLQGKLSDTEDVDYYGFSLLWYRSLSKADQYNLDVTITLDHIPEGCDYALVLYDQNGNQVGIGTDNGEGGKSITIPNWSMNNNGYTVKVYAKDGSPVNGDEYYHLSFQTKQANKDHGAYRQMQESQKHLAALREKAYNGEDTAAEKEALQKIQEKYDVYYADQLAKLHQEQAKESLQGGEVPGREQVDQWLEKLAAGEELTDQEMKLLNIFATAQEIDCAKGNRELETDVKEKVFSYAFMDWNRDDSVDVEITCTVEPSGQAEVIGTDGKMKEAFQRAAQHYAERLWDIYLVSSPEILHRNKQEQYLIKAAVDIERFLHKASEGNVGLRDISIENGIVKGLPDHLEKLFNGAKRNPTYERYREDMIAIKNYERTENKSIL